MSRQQGAVLILVLCLGSLGCTMAMGLLYIAWGMVKTEQSFYLYEQKLLQMEQQLVQQSTSFEQMTLPAKLRAGHWLGFVPDTLEFMSEGVYLIALEQPAPGFGTLKVIEGYRLG